MEWIKRILDLLGPVAMYLCVATVLAQVAVVGALAGRASWSWDKCVDLLAVAYDVDLESLREKREELIEGEDREDPAMEQIIEERALRHLDLDLRQQAVSEGLDTIRLLQSQLIEDKRRYRLLRESFDQSLARLQQNAKDSALVEVQRTLEAMAPKQAKDQLLRIMDSQPDGDGLDPVVTVVAIVKAMPLDKRKKILAEFKTEQEADKLAMILEEIRKGVPEAPLIEETRERLQAEGKTPS